MITVIFGVFVSLVSHDGDKTSRVFLSRPGLALEGTRGEPDVWPLPQGRAPAIAPTGKRDRQRKVMGPLIVALSTSQYTEQGMLLRSVYQHIRSQVPNEMLTFVC